MTLAGFSQPWSQILLHCIPLNRQFSKCKAWRIMINNMALWKEICRSYKQTEMALKSPLTARCWCKRSEMAAWLSPQGISIRWMFLWWWRVELSMCWSRCLTPRLWPSGPIRVQQPLCVRRRRTSRALTDPRRPLRTLRASLIWTVLSSARSPSTWAPPHLRHGLSSRQNSASESRTQPLMMRRVLTSR